MREIETEPQLVLAILTMNSLCEYFDGRNSIANHVLIHSSLVELSEKINTALKIWADITRAWLSSTSTVSDMTEE